MSIRSIYLRAGLFRCFKYSGAMWLHERFFSPHFLTILLFHRVTDLIPPDGLTVCTTVFRRMCEMLHAGFQVVPLARVFEILQRGQRVPRRCVAITFDDCYLDNYQAAQVLHEFGFPATFFVPTSYVGTKKIFDWDRQLPPMPNLSWEHLKEMARLGHDIGSHTVTHANLGKLSAKQAWFEMLDSRRTIEDRLGRPCRFFAYPFGGPDDLRPEYAPLIERAGYHGAVSAFGGFVRTGMNPRILPREAMPYFKDMTHLELHLTGCLHAWHSLIGRDAAVLPEPQTSVTPNHAAPSLTLYQSRKRQ